MQRQQKQPQHLDSGIIHYCLYTSLYAVSVVQCPCEANDMLDIQSRYGFKPPKQMKQSSACKQCHNLHVHGKQATCR